MRGQIESALSTSKAISTTGQLEGSDERRALSDSLVSERPWDVTHLPLVGRDEEDAVPPASVTETVPGRMDATSLQNEWRSDMGVEPTQDGITAPQTALKSVFSLLTRVKPGPHKSTCSLVGPCEYRWLVGRLLAAEQLN